MYKKVVLSTCVLAFFAVILSAYARLSDAGLGCPDWPACYEENAQKERQPPQDGLVRAHGSWQWKLHSQVVQALGIFTIALCGLSWKRRRERGQSPLLPTLLLGLTVFLAAFGILAFNHLTRPVIVSVHLAGGVTMLALLVWISLGQVTRTSNLNIVEATRLRHYAWAALVLLLAQIILGGWVSSNFAALACPDFPLCGDALLSHGEAGSGESMMLYAKNRSIAIHSMHRIGALFTVLFLIWLGMKTMAVQGLRKIGRTIFGFAVLQPLIGISIVLVGLPLAGVVLHNAAAMALVVALVTLCFKLNETENREPAKDT